MAFVLPRSNAPARRIDRVDRDHIFLKLWSQQTDEATVRQCGALLNNY